MADALFEGVRRRGGIVAGLCRRREGGHFDGRRRRGASRWRQLLGADHRFRQFIDGDRRADGGQFRFAPHAHGQSAAFLSQYLDPHPGRALPLESQQLGGAARHIDDAAMGKGAPVVDPDIETAPVVQVGDPDDTRQRQGAVRGRQVVHIEDFTVGRRFAVKLGAVPRGDTAFHIPIIDFRVIPYPFDLVGFSNLVCRVRRVFLRLVDAFCRMHHELGFRAGGQHQQDDHEKRPAAGPEEAATHREYTKSCKQPKNICDILMVISLSAS